MAKIYLNESEIHVLRDRLKAKLEGEDAVLLEKLCSPMELAIRGYRVVQSLKPLVTSLWVTMNERQDPNRFIVERMLQDMDALLDFWVVPDDESSEDEGIPSE